MPTVYQILQERVEAALRQAFTAQEMGAVEPDVLKVVPCANPQFGDYQFNGALPLAKSLGIKPPRALAQRIVDALDVEGISESPQIAGPGFINFRLTNEFIAAQTAALLGDPRLGVPPVAQPQTVVVDFSAPNVAKAMHVGHIRSTIIGDAIARLLRFAGHNVITDNHIGDWGTAFGKIIVGWKHHLDHDWLMQDPIGEMERLYKLINAESEKDESVADAARAEIAKLQAGDETNLAIWRQLRELSWTEFERIYERLDIKFDHVLGESDYNDRLGAVVDDLKARGIAEESEGAVVVKFDAPPQLVDKPMLIQKKDGAALYATTDLATIQYRMENWHPDAILYVVDSRQTLHFQQVFATAAKWGYGSADLRHISFGTILGDDGTPLKTRSGDSVKLRDLLDEAQRRALAIVQENNPDMPAERQEEVARVIGISAIKYADLSPNRTSDYTFSWDKMLALTGNSAVYLHYAYVRNRSLLRNAAEAGYEISSAPQPRHAAEMKLVKQIFNFPLAIETALSDYRLNAIVEYLFELSQTFSVFWEQCPVLKSDDPERGSRLGLVKLTSDVLRQGLSLLGIQTIEKM